MEQINKVILRGVVGAVKTTEVAERTITRLSVATNYVYKTSDGMPIIETTWHNVTYWGKTDAQKGSSVDVEGRLKTNRYTGTDGVERTMVEIIASKVETINE